MDNTFNQNLVGGDIDVEDGKKQSYNEKTKAVRKENLKIWKDNMAETIAETKGEIMSQLGTRSNDIEVTKALVYGKDGIIKKEDHDENVVNVVGYLVKNISKTPINATTTVCSEADGKFVKTPQAIVIAPGQEVALRKADFVELMANPEFSFKAANGKLPSRAATTATTPAEIEKFLEKHNFLFANGKVNDFVVRISTQVGDKDWRVIDDYRSTFAYLENKEEKSAGRQKKPSIDAAALAANYVNRLIKSQKQ